MTMDTAAAEPPSPRRRASPWVWALMIVSLAVNMLVIGMVGGSMWAVRRGGYWDAPVFIERTQRFMRGLPDDRRAAIRGLFAQYRPQLQPYWRELRASRVAIGHLIEGDYTPDALDDALTDMFEKESRARQATRPMIAAVLKQLKPAERRHFLSVYMPYLSEIQGGADRVAP